MQTDNKQSFAGWRVLMTWNYRVVHREVNDEHIYAIHEAYYDGDKPTSITEESVHPQGETPEELARDCENYLRAIEKPVLEYADFEISST